jgi:hypothetical protein
LYDSGPPGPLAASKHTTLKPRPAHPSHCIAARGCTATTLPHIGRLPAQPPLTATTAAHPPTHPPRAQVVGDKSSTRESLALLTSALGLAKAGDAKGLAEVKPYATQAVQEFVRAPDVFQCDLLALPAVQQLEQVRAAGQQALRAAALGPWAEHGGRSGSAWRHGLALG